VTVFVAVLVAVEVRVAVLVAVVVFVAVAVGDGVLVCVGVWVGTITVKSGGGMVVPGVRVAGNPTVTASMQ
jgi:hypothetical protein